MKKKILSLFLALLMASSSASMITADGTDRTAEANLTALAPANRILGDINADGGVDIKDAMDLFQHSMLPDLFQIDYPGTTDFNKDGNVDIADALYLFQHSMMPDLFPIEWGNTSEDPETEAPETEAPETQAPETEAPETQAPETEAPETEAPETQAPETEAPETEAPETQAPETEAPETEAPETQAPETEAPETEAPETEAPETEAPETEAPETEAPETEAPETEAPETQAPETEAPKPDNYIGDCGNIYWSESNNTVGPIFLDVFRHRVSLADYKSAIKDGAVTVEEDSGIFELVGWISMNFTDFELAWRRGTYSNESYLTSGAVAIQREPAVYQAAQALGYSNATGFAFSFDIANFKSGEEIHLFLRDKKTNKTYCFYELTVNINGVNDATNAALLEKYALGKGSNMNLNVPDPIKVHESVTAPNNDPTLKLWFDHITEKVARYDISGKNSNQTSYTIQMGKNEMEGCQFFLYSPTARKVTITVSDFENDKGEKLPTELGVEYYIEDGYLTLHGYPEDLVYPDGVIPYDSYIAHSSNNENGRYGNDAKSKLNYGPYICVGPFSGNPSKLSEYPFRESIRGFTLQTTTTKDTTPGAYKATVSIYDATTGKCIKMANVYTYVYDVVLSDETPLDTAFGLWDITEIYKHHYSSDASLTKYSDAEIVRATANLFLKHRITLTGNNSFFSTMGRSWFENPRVTSIRVVSKTQYNNLKDMPTLAKKMFYYGQDEPGVARGWRPITWPNGKSETVYDNTGLLSVLAIAKEADGLKNDWGWNDYRLLVPFERTMDFTSFDFNSVDKTQRFPSWYNQYAVTTQRDSIEYLSKSANVWSATFTGATPKELAPAILGERYMQTDTQDKIFGEFQTRMEALQAQGHEIWNYVACEPQYTAPYQNILLFNDGTEGRTMFWTTYMLNGTGFLYWHVSYYDAAGNNTYTLRNPFSKTGPGDGILVYPGSAYNQLDPIPSIRLFNIRDGIEDYQLLTMLANAKGDRYTDELVSHIVTSTVTFTRDDDKVYNAHAFLLRELEKAGK